MSTVGNWRGPDIIKEGLVIYFDSGSPNSYFVKTASIIKDISGNGYNCTLNNGPIYNNADGGSLKLDGTNDSITIPSHPESTGLTLSFWLNIPSTGWTGLDTIIGDGNQNNTIGYIWIYRGYVNGVQWQFATDTVRSSVDDFSLFAGLFDTWANIVFTANYTNPSAVVFSMYRNGTLSSTHTVAGGAKAPISLTRYIGSYNGGIYFDRFSIANYLEYNRALSDTEVLQNFNATRARFGL